jgi:competence protein ComEC
MTSNIQSAFRPVIGKNAGYLALGAIVVFVLISGAPASILRAAVMASLVILAQFVGRPVRPINLIIITAGVLAIFETKIIFQIGFQLSVAATYGVMRLSPLVKYTMRNIRLPKSLKDIFAETISAIVLTAPILIYSFGQLSVVSPLTNILILPLIPLLMGFGLLATVGVLISVKLGGLLTLLTWPILQWIIWVTDKFSRLNWALVRFDLPIWGLIMILVVIVAGTEQLQMFAQKKPDIAEKIINSSPTKI